MCDRRLVNLSSRCQQSRFFARLHGRRVLACACCPPQTRLSAQMATASPSPIASVGATTSSTSLADQIKKYRARDIGGAAKEEADRAAEVLAEAKITAAKGGVGLAPKSMRSAASAAVSLAEAEVRHNKFAAFETLQSRCIGVICDTFEDRARRGDGLESVPSHLLPAVTARLPLDLDLELTAPHVHDENYWKRACLAREGWGSSQIAEHGLTWKQLFFEQHLQEALEDFGWDEKRCRYEPNAAELEALMRQVRASQDYIFCLEIRQLLSHLDMEEVCLGLPNLTKLSLTYGAKSVGMKYDRMLFGMKILDATSLAKCCKNSDALTTLVLRQNLLDDDLLRMLMTGMMKNNSITHLDLAHNKVTNHGARLLSKLLGAKSVITSLNLCDNQIHAEGGRYLGRGLRHNDSMVELDLRLNRLTDEGGRMLLDGLRENYMLSRLNLSSNSLGHQTTMALGALLRSPQFVLQALDLTANELDATDAAHLRECLEANKMLTSLDLRANRMERGNMDISEIDLT